MSLADQIIEHGPYTPGEVQRGFKHLPLTDETALNELRDELIAARALKELLASGRFEVWAAADSDPWMALGCNNGCGWVVDLGSSPIGLAELVQRAGEHAEGCR